MRYKLFSLAFIGLLVIIYFLPIPVSQTKSVHVDMSFDKLLYEVNDLHHWAAWWPDTTTIVMGDTVFQTSSARFAFKRRDPLSITLSEANGAVLHKISVEPDAEHSSHITWRRVCYLKTFVNDKIYQLITAKHYNIEDLLYAIKKHVEDPVEYYGFNIRVEPVTDTFIMVMRKDCVKDSVSACLRGMFVALNDQLQKINYSGKAEKMFHVDSSSSNSVNIMAGLSIEKLVDVSPIFQLMTMPKAHVVVGDFEGDYKDIGSIHKAMISFMKDHNISGVAVPYEKLYSMPISKEDSQHIKVKVYYPPYIP